MILRLSVWTCLVLPLLGQDLAIHHAEHFSAKRGDDAWEMTIRQEAGKTEQTWIILDPDAPKRTGPRVLRAPLKKVISLSTTNLPFMKALGELESLKAVADFRHVNTPEVLEAIKDRKVSQVGSFQQLNVERVLELDVDVVMTYSLGTNAYDTGGTLSKIGQQVFFLNAYLESSYLARAEWIKFFGVLYDKVEDAEKIFKGIETRYQDVQSKMIDEKRRPTVFCNRPFRGTWYLPGGDSTTAHLIASAGGEYLWSHVNQKQAITLDVEAVLQKAIDADVWLVSGHQVWKNLEDVPASNPAYSSFKALKTGRVYANDGRLSESGGNDIFETALLEPDVLLKDYLKMIQPNALPDHQLIYHRKLESKDSSRR